MSIALRPLQEVGLSDSYLTQVSNRLGMATKALSVVATASSTFRFTLIRTAS